jgi:hypothetical protein
MLIHYTKGYKYQLQGNVVIYLPQFKHVPKIETEYISLRNGYLYIRQGYAWDGASGLTYDSKNTIQGSLAHDALYQLMRMGLLPFRYWKKADIELKRICKDDGMSSFRAWYWIMALALAGGSAAKTKNKKEILVAP